MDHTDVVKTEFFSFNFTRISLGVVAHCKDVLLAVSSVVVEVDLGVEADNLTLGSFAEGVDFDLEYDYNDRF
jgi:hypothetical protein